MDIFAWILQIFWHDSGFMQFSKPRSPRTARSTHKIAGVMHTIVCANGGVDPQAVFEGDMERTHSGNTAE